MAIFFTIIPEIRIRTYHIITLDVRLQVVTKTAKVNIDIRLYIVSKG